MQPKSSRCKQCAPTFRKGVTTKSPIVLAMSFALNKARSKKEVLVTIDDILQLWVDQQGKCALTSLALELPSYNTTCRDIRVCASLDRIDSSKGYIKENLQ